MLWLRNIKVQHLWQWFNPIKKRTMKTYVFIYLDKKGNEIKRKNVECLSIKDARKWAKMELAESLQNDLHKIIVKKF
jgi:hypothetical protein